MTREQMELLLNYFDAKMSLLAQDIKANDPAPGNYMTEWRNKAHDSRNRLLASCEPAPLVTTAITAEVELRDWRITGEVDKIVRDPKVSRIKQEWYEPYLPPGQRVFVYYGLKIEGAEPWPKSS